MRLFGYYAWHSFVNQLRKLFKTWVLIFLVVCMAIGALIGFGAAMLDDAAGEDEEIVDSEVIEEEEPDIPLQQDAEALELVELIVGGVILAVFAFGAISADKNGSRIFLPADVNLLFASPMKPQSVLLFRLMTQLGTSILASVYLLFQLPNLVFNMGLSIWVALAMIATWCLTIVVGKLLQIFLYTVCSTHVKLKNHLRNSIYAFLLVIAGAYLMYWKTSGDNYLVAAVGFFNGSVSRYIPLWGWLKGFCMFAIEGNIAGLLMSLAAIVVGGILLTYIIWHVKADFYEDAMAKSEETAELLAAAQADKGGVTVIRRKKDRSDKLRRDGMQHGSGANVFFYKAMYNRFRFAHLGIFTKTSETYLFAAVAVSVLCRFVIQAEGLIPVMLTLGVLTFFRAMGNPLEQDTQMDHFLLIPENTWHKLFWSLMGGTANCFLDLLPAVIVVALLLGENMLIALAWIPLIVSVDFFATTVGAFKIHEWECGKQSIIDGKYMLFYGQYLDGTLRGWYLIHKPTGDQIDIRYENVEEFVRAHGDPLPRCTCENPKYNTADESHGWHVTMEWLLEMGNIGPGDLSGACLYRQDTGDIDTYIKHYPIYENDAFYIEFSWSEENHKWIWWLIHNESGDRCDLETEDIAAFVNAHSGVE